MRIETTTAGGITHSLLRTIAGILFLMHGGQKFFGWFGGVDGQGGTVELMSLFGLAGILELVGGTLIILGLFTRPAAFILSGQMAVAYFMAHFPKAFWPIENQGEPAALFSFIFLFLACNGGCWTDVVLPRRLEGIEEVAALRASVQPGNGAHADAVNPPRVVVNAAEHPLFHPIDPESQAAVVGARCGGGTPV